MTRTQRRRETDRGARETDRGARETDRGARETGRGARGRSAGRALASLTPGSAGSGRRIVLTAAALVLVVAAAGAAIVFAQTGGPRQAAYGQAVAGRARAHPDDRRAAAPGADHQVSAGGQYSTRNSVGVGRQGSGGRQPAADGTTSGRPAARPRVAVAPRVRQNPQATAVDAFLVGYFTAINQHDYRAYLRLFSAQTRQALSEAAFEAGYGTTVDSAAELTGLVPAGPGRLAAALTFTSHQAPASAPAHAECLRWAVTVYLAGHGGRYVIGNPPAGYYAANRPC